MELREKIARIIWEAEPESKLEHFDNLLCGPILSDLYSTADEILAIPEIAKALEACKPIYILGEMTEETYGWPGKPDGIRRIKPDGRVS